MKRYLILLAVLWLYACAKEPLPDPCKIPDCIDTVTVKKEGLELIWQKPLRSDNEYTICQSPIILKDKICFFYDITDQEKILFVNKQDSIITRFFGPNVGSYMGRHKFNEDEIVVFDHKKLFRVKSADNYEEIISFGADDNVNITGNVFNDDIYISTRSFEGGYKFGNLYKINIASGSVDTIFKKNATLDWGSDTEISTNDPVFLKYNEDDYLMFSFGKHKDNYSKNSYYTEIFNLSKKIKIYEDTLIRYGRDATFIHNDQQICVSDDIYCSKPLTNNIIWKLPNISRTRWVTNGKGAIFNNLKLYLLDQGHFVEIDALTGKMIYDSPELFFPQSNSRMTYFDGVFYWTAAQGGISWIFGLRASDKKVVLKMKSPNQGKAPYYNDTNYDWNGLQIDPETRLGYTADGFFAQCFRIPESYE